MAETLGRAVLELTTDETSLKSGISKAEKSAEALQKKFDKIGKNLTKFVTLPILALGAAAIKTASDAEEIENKFGAVFKHTAQDVREWAEEYSQSIGRSTTENLKFLSVIQDTLVPLGFMRDAAADMSTVVVTLATDLASFNNLPTEQVINDIQSAVVGNTETLRKYGVVASQTTIAQEALNSGLIENKNGLDANSKARAILNLLVKGTADAQGDALRTAGSTANLMKSVLSLVKDLAEGFGKLLLPAAQNILTGFKDVVTWLNNLSDPFKKVIRNVGIFAATAGPLLILLPRLVIAVKSLFTAFTVGAGPVGLIATAIAGVVAGITFLGARAREAKGKLELLNEAVKGGLSSVEDYEEALEILNERNKNTIQLYEKNKKLIDATKEKYKSATAALSAFEGGLTDVEKGMVKQTAAALGMAGWIQEAIDKGKYFKAIQNSLRLAIDDHSQSLSYLSGVGKGYSEFIEKRTAIEANLEDAIGNREEAERLAREEIERSIEGFEAQAAALLERQKQEEEIARKKEEDVERERERTQAFLSLIQTRRAGERELAEEEQEDSNKRREFHLMQMNDEQQQIVAINDQRQAFSDAGISRVDVSKWAEGEINRIKEEFAELERERQAQLDEDEKERQDERVANFIGTLNRFLNGIRNFANAVGQIYTASSQARLQQLEEEYGILSASEQEYQDFLAVKQQERLADLTGAELEEEQLRIKAQEAEKTRLAELEKKKKEIQWEEARRQKRLGIFNAVVSMASAIIGMLANPGGIAGAVMSAIAAATGVAQIAAIRAQPLPKLQAGADFIVPPGFEGDKFPMLAESGERVQVTPRSGVDGEGDMIHFQNILDGKVIQDFITKAIRDKRIIVDAEAIS